MIKNYRLPKNLKPSSYHISTRTNFDSLTEPQDYNGSVEIQFSVTNQTDLIVLHHIDLAIDISSINVAALNGQKVNVLSTSYDNETNFFTVKLSDMLNYGQNYTISMDYVGKLLSNNIGFYKSSYTDAQGNRRYI